MTLAAGVWILDLTGNPGLAALAALGIYAPSLAAPWLGALVDRFPRRVLLITVEIALGVALLSLLTVDRRGEIWLIHGVLLMRGVGYVLVDAGETALLPSVLPARLLGAVNGWRSSAEEGMKLLAPLAGAALYVWSGPVPVILLSAALPFMSAVLYALLRPHPPAARPAEAAPTPAARPAETEPAAVLCPAETGPAAAHGGGETDSRQVTLGWASVRQGLIVLLREPLRGPVLIAAAAIAVSGLTNAAVLSRLVGGLHLPATHLGFLSSAQGAGSILAGLLVGRLLARLPAVRVAGLGAVIFAVACLAWALPWWPSMVVGSVLAGLGLPWALIAAVTVIQTGTPEHLLGRVAATGNMVMFGPLAATIPFGAVLIALDDRVPLLAGALFVLVVALVHGRRRSSRLPGRVRVDA
jgi:MFS family permease